MTMFEGTTFNDNHGPVRVSDTLPPLSEHRSDISATNPLLRPAIPNTAYLKIFIMYLIVI